jgi:hypothetical protein
MLLMGGQACISYGAAEFSRDVDLAVLASPQNLDALRDAMAELQAEVIAVPPFDAGYLEKGHAIHFRCHEPETDGLRVDIMSKMRGVDPFEELWSRRTSVDVSGDFSFDVLALPDLVKAKKTQRDKDWPMIRRLLEADYFQRRESATDDDIRFWLREMRTPELLCAIASANPDLCGELVEVRPLLDHASKGDSEAVSDALLSEEAAERRADRAYWEPLRGELERLRHSR